MNTSTLSESRRTLTATRLLSGAARRGSSPPAAARAALKLLNRMQEGTLELHAPDGSVHRYGQARPGAPDAVMVLHDWSVCAAALRSGDIGFAEGFIDGSWSSPNPAELMRLLLAHRQAFEKALYGSWWGSLLHRVAHAFNRNTRHGSRRNISAHYDLGNDFYALWLDRTMNYSSAWFEGDAGRTLEAAQEAKVRRALRSSGVRPGERLLEIGCGWGAVAESAARVDGARVVGLTLSAEQLKYARERVRAAGVQAAVDLRLQDYREVCDGPFDAIVSIEMFEAVGRAYWPVFFDAVRRLLKPGGRACIQTIVIRDDLFERYARSTDFIQRHVFPGGMLPSASQFEAHAARCGLRVVDRLAFGRDYAETLRRWHASFAERMDAVRAQGFDARFERLWTFYLAYCEAAFDAGTTDVIQFTLEHE